jgi:ankyrin repeat protein
MAGCKSSLLCQVTTGLTHSFRFLWTACQLGVLRHHSSSTIRDALDDLPEDLDKTYERILRGINQSRQNDARHLLQCLAVAIRSLRVEELSDILAMKFSAGQLPKYAANRREGKPEKEILLACSSLITVVNVDGSRVVQFAHSSVKEYLTSERLSNAGAPLSQYHILPHSAHTLLAQASLCVLLALDGQVDKESVKNFPLAEYAGRYWIDHVEFGSVSSGIEDAMKCLFDPAKPHFSNWVWIYDIDLPFRPILFAPRPTQPMAVPLYHATLCGFCGLVEHLIATRPQDINARGGRYVTPLHAAIQKVDVKDDNMKLRHEKGVDVNTVDDYTRPVGQVSQRGRLDIMKLLLRHHAFIDARDGQGYTPLIWASLVGKLDVVRILLRNGASVDSYNSRGWTALILASQNGHLDVVRLLLQSGAAVDVHNDDGLTALMFATKMRQLDVVRLLLQSGAAVNAHCNGGWTALMLASETGHLDVIHLLLQIGAAVDAHSDNGYNSLMAASHEGHLDVVRLLLQSGAAVDAHDNKVWTSLMLASENGQLDVVRLLLQSGAAVDAHDDNGWTSLSVASQNGHLDVVRLLLQSSTAVNAHDNNGWTPLSVASKNGHSDVIRLLLQSGAAVDAHDNDGWTSLMEASQNGHLDVVRLLLQSDAAADAHNNTGRTSLMIASRNGHLDVIRLLLQSGAAVDSFQNDGRTPLMLASQNGHLDVVHLLVQTGAAVEFQDSKLKAGPH